jgi:endoglycosylceramidase
MRFRLLLALPLLAALVVPLQAEAAAPAPQFLHVGSASGPAGLPQVVDESGRSVVLRGINVNGLVDYWTKDLRPPYPIAAGAYASGRCPADSAATTAVPLCERDLEQIAELGLDVIRLPVSWSLLEPTPGHLDPVPVARIAQVVGWARTRGVRVVIDLHQDAWSKFVFAPAGTLCPPGSNAMDGGDGAPAWASEHLTPACAPGGTRELEPPVQEAAQRFWSDLPAPDRVGLQEHYASVVLALAQRFAADPTVAGYELMNEPQPGSAPGVMDSTELMAFHAKVIDTVVAAVPRFRQLFFVEPAGTRNVTGARTFLAPWSTYSTDRNVVYAPHVYTGVFTADSTVLQGKAGQLQSAASDYAAAVGDAKALGLPLWVGEFGNDPHDDRRILDPHYTQQDANAIGGALWIWKEHGSWGALAAPYDGGGVPRADRLRRISTAYPTAVGGTLDMMASDPFRGTALIRGHGPTVGRGDRQHATVIVLPRPFTATPVVTGATYDLVVVNGVRQVTLFPRGGGWELRV